MTLGKQISPWPCLVGEITYQPLPPPANQTLPCAMRARRISALAVDFGISYYMMDKTEDSILVCLYNNYYVYMPVVRSRVVTFALAVLQSQVLARETLTLHYTLSK